MRCFICFGNYKEGDRLKQFPHCKHVCHIKCLELWMAFEAKCPECNRVYPGLEPMLEYQAATSDLPLEMESTGNVDDGEHTMSNSSSYRVMQAEYSIGSRVGDAQMVDNALNEPFLNGAINNNQGM